jgi:hypothetical protein
MELEESDYGSDFDANEVENARVHIFHQSRSGNECHYEQLRTLPPLDLDSDYGSDFDIEAVENTHTKGHFAKASVRIRPDLQALGEFATQTSSNLLTLPPEIRNLFYEAIFEDFTAELIPMQWYESPSILRVCRQLYGEAISIFYSTATFRARSSKILERRLSRLRMSHRRLVRKVQVDSVNNEEVIPIPANIPLWNHKMVPLCIKSALKAETAIHRCRESFQKYKDIRLTRVEASIETRDGTILWSSDPTLVLLNMIDEEVARLKVLEAPIVIDSDDGEEDGGTDSGSP